MEKLPEDLQAIWDKVIKAAMLTIEWRENFVWLPIINGPSFTKEDLQKLIISSHQAFYEAIWDSKKWSVAANDPFYWEDKLAA